MTAPTSAVRWLLARAAVRATGALHIAVQRESDALFPVCGAAQIRSREIETPTRLTDPALLCAGCAAMAASIGDNVEAGVALFLRRTADGRPSDVRLIDVAPGHVQIPTGHTTRVPDAGLIHSIAEHGVLQPVVARRTSSGLQLVAGSRRLAAAALAGLLTVPVLVRDLDPGAAVIAALAENLHRQDLDPIAQAHAYQDALTALGCTKDALADRLGVSRAQLSNTVRLLSLPEHLQEQVASGALTAAHGRALLRIEDPAEQDALAAQVLDRGLTTRETDAAARRMAKPSPTAQDPRLGDVAQLLTGLLDARVLVTAGAKGTRIVIEVPDSDRARVLTQLGLHAAA